MNNNYLKEITYGNFNLFEFCNSKDQCALKLDINLVIKAQLLRDIVGSVDITSGYRTSEYNKSIGGSTNSNHLIGTAMDVKFDFTPWYIDALEMLCSGLGFTNIGIYIDKSTDYVKWLHLDISPRWNATKGWRHYRDSAIKIYYV